MANLHKNSTKGILAFCAIVVLFLFPLFQFNIIKDLSRRNKCVHGGDGEVEVPDTNQSPIIISDDGISREEQLGEVGEEVSETRKEHNGGHQKFPNMFVMIQNQLYKKATAHVNTPRRKEFTLSDWSRGTGGLLDSDRLLLGELYRNASSVFEFGLGESTKIAALVGVPRYAGVDSDVNWVDKARHDSAMDHFRFTFADIGPTKEWGNPTKETLQKIHFNYQIAPLIVENDAFDIYLVDGRWRIACACVSMLHAMNHGGDMSKVMVGIHDSDRTMYWEHFGKVGEVVQKSEKLWMYKLRDNVTEVDIFDVWKQTVNMLQRR
mmetsp:Transcript_12054/g.17567  ORF Transcript_12054/g.17567 Transcript_12054/m.17567 type:complete len:321 (+) Transcript_12054:219-1181(+)|eukprot:7361274-Ditylum_brightwellii.AAC.2